MHALLRTGFLDHVEAVKVWLTFKAVRVGATGWVVSTVFALIQSVQTLEGSSGVTIFVWNGIKAPEVIGALFALHARVKTGQRLGAHASNTHRSVRIQLRHAGHEIETTLAMTTLFSTVHIFCAGIVFNAAGHAVLAILKTFKRSIGHAIDLKMLFGHALWVKVVAVAPRNQSISTNGSSNRTIIHGNCVRKDCTQIGVGRF